MRDPNSGESGAENPKFAQGTVTTAGKRALVVANEEISGERLVGSVLGRLGSDVEEVFVVAPALADSALDHIMGAVDAAIPPAQERLDATLQAFRAAGVEARGEVGDSDPIQAINDEIINDQRRDHQVRARPDPRRRPSRRGRLLRREGAARAGRTRLRPAGAGASGHS